MLLKHPKKFLNAAEGSTQLVLLFMKTPRYLWHVKTVFYWEPITVYLIISKHCFVDYKKAFASCMARRAVGCYEVIWDRPKTDQSETQLAVLFNGHLSEWCEMTTGNRQGIHCHYDHLLCSWRE